MEAATGFEPGIKVLQTSALPLGYAAILIKMERKTGFEPATPTLARWCSTTELLPRVGLWFIYYLKQKSYLRQKPLAFVAN